MPGVSQEGGGVGADRDGKVLYSIKLRVSTAKRNGERWREKGEETGPTPQIPKTGEFPRSLLSYPRRGENGGRRGGGGREGIVHELYNKNTPRTWRKKLVRNFA